MDVETGDPCDHKCLSAVQGQSLAHYMGQSAAVGDLDTTLVDCQNQKGESRCCLLSINSTSSV